jgi:hypothetical protein
MGRESATTMGGHSGLPEAIPQNRGRVSKWLGDSEQAAGSLMRSISPRVVEKWIAKSFVDAVSDHPMG